ncbi:Tripartite-type tricarboxylate transporter, receptor component TctC [Tindallia magadiensis]|uniref:Tripartite-type tricarboxylate transporter, receptor component TctC n=1 Tax=Tindallia magadiensis TaxID=69895 RepID=A0A1I3EL96_9FIRM|nr:tripartite tricarboxylate transporter substrate binding protein [Tindallia magadiensis]SFH99643.1 Tripartite-type tricarboxylate transporter, receptor component TctC [Tindallia magadiensis]
MKKRILLSTILILLITLLIGCAGGAEEVDESSDVEVTEPVEKAEESDALDFPERPIEIVVSSGTGGSIDLTARTIAAHSDYLGTSVEVTNMPGAAFTIAAQHVIDSEPDGYTLLATTDSAFGYSPLAMPEDVTYTYEDIVGVSRIAMNQFSIAINADKAESLGIESFGDLLDYTESNPGELTVGYSSVLFDVWREVLRDIGYDMTAVHQDSGGEAATQTAGGHIDVYFGAMPGIIPYHEDGSVVILTTLPFEFYDGIPSVEEYPEVSDALGMSQYGVVSIYAPADTPQEVIDYLDSRFQEMFTNEAFVSMLEDQGMKAYYEGHEDFQRTLKEMCEQALRFEEVLQNFGS